MTRSPSGEPHGQQRWLAIDKILCVSVFPCTLVSFRGSGGQDAVPNKKPDYRSTLRA